MNTNRKTKAKHTPGPWQFYEGKLRARFPVTIIEVGAESAKTPIVKWQGFDDSNRSAAEHAANARLIAAAPMLVDACKTALWHLTHDANGRECQPADQSLATCLKMAILLAE